MNFEPEKILQVLACHGVDYVMIGGLAAVLHGSNLATTDVDITPALGDDNLSRLSRALTELDARVRTGDAPRGLPFQHDARSLGAVGVWNLTTNVGDLDISFVPSGTQGFTDLKRDAIAIEVFGTPVRIAALADIIRSKEAAGRPKDLIALPGLLRLLHEIESDQPG